MPEALPNPAPLVTIQWPDGSTTSAPVGSDWLQAAAAAGVVIPTGCLGGSCGACEIDVNGEVLRACIATIPAAGTDVLQVELAVDPYW